MESGLFQIPRDRLQKQVLSSGKTYLHSVPDHVSILQHSTDTKYLKSPCELFHPDIEASESIKRTNIAKIRLQQVTKNYNQIQKLLKQNLDILNDKKMKLMEEISKIEENYIQNLNSRKTDQSEVLKYTSNFLKSTKEMDAEKAKQDMLLQVGLIMESLTEELRPYEDIMGNLSFHENTIRSKGDTLSIKKDLLSRRKNVILGEIDKEFDQADRLKKKLFETSFKRRENTFQKLNLINKLSELDAKSKRKVLELETMHSAMRHKADLVRTETQWLYWFLDWVLFDVVGKQSLTGIDESSSPHEKTQAIIDCYKSIRLLIMERQQ